jgi:hypothetical protein
MKMKKETTMCLNTKNKGKQLAGGLNYFDKRNKK